MIIEHRPCPRCQVPNTARLADGVAVCFNCRASWRTADPEGTVNPPLEQRAPAAPATARPAPTPPPEPPPYRFSAQELVRLATYRAAVAAGFYNEGLDDGLNEGPDDGAVDGPQDSPVEDANEGLERRAA